MNIELLEIGAPPPSETCGCAICAIGRIQTESIKETMANTRAREFGHALLKATDSLAMLEQDDFVNLISILERMDYPVTASIIHETQKLQIFLRGVGKKFHEECEAHHVTTESLVN